MTSDTHKKDEPLDEAHVDAPGAPDEYGDSGGPVGEVDPDAIAGAQDDVARLEAELDEWKGKYQRALADFQNFQRRARENETEARRQAITSVVGSLLTVLDTFDLALQQAGPESGSAEQIAKGVEMIKGQMLHALSVHDVARIEPNAGDDFDPHAHEAVQQMASDEVEPGRIAALFQVGYRMGERTLRPAKVMVAKSPESESDRPEQAADDGGITVDDARTDGPES